MAYIIGLVTPEEERELEARGWELEDAPDVFNDEDIDVTGEREVRMRMVWVDNDMFSIMSGPDWDTDGSERGTDGEEPVSDSAPALPTPVKAQENKE